MRKTIPTLLLASAANLCFGTVVTITNSGNNFIPNMVTISLGDTIRFQITSSHDAREVSQATWSANGNTALPGGFQTPFGGGFVFPPQLGVGTHYYVCTPHAGQGMKGRIIVEDVSTGLSDAWELPTLRLFPVPAADHVVVEGGDVNAGLPWELFGQDGRLVRTGTLSGARTVINIADLAPGAYVVRIADDRRQVLRLVRE